MSDETFSEKLNRAAETMRTMSKALSAAGKISFFAPQRRD